MMPGAPFPPPQSSASVLLWHPRTGAYLRRGGEGFTRRLTHAARVTREEARQIKASGHLGHLEIEPWPEGPQPIRPGAVPGLRRAAWADLTDEDLLRRAVLALLSGGKRPAWTVVMDALVLNSAAAVKLCRRLNIEQIERTDR